MYILQTQRGSHRARKLSPLGSVHRSSLSTFFFLLVAARNLVGVLRTFKTLSWVLCRRLTENFRGRFGFPLSEVGSCFPGRRNSERLRLLLLGKFFAAHRTIWDRRSVPHVRKTNERFPCAVSVKYATKCITAEFVFLRVLYRPDVLDPRHQGMAFIHVLSISTGLYSNQNTYSGFSVQYNCTYGVKKRKLWHWLLSLKFSFLMHDMQCFGRDRCNLSSKY